MSQSFDSLQALVKDQFNAVIALNGALTQGLGKIAVETFDYSRTSMQSNTALLQRLAAVKTFNEAVQVQNEHAKATYEAAVAETRKLGELFTDLSKATFKSVVVNGESSSAPVKVPSVGKLLRAAE